MLGLSAKRLREWLRTRGRTLVVSAGRGLYFTDDVREALKGSTDLQRLESLPRGYVTVNIVAKRLDTTRKTVIRLATPLRILRESASGACMPTTSIPKIRRELCALRDKARINRPYDNGLLPRGMVALRDVAARIIPGGTLSVKAVRALARAARVRIHAERTARGVVSVVTNQNIARVRAAARKQAEAVRGAYAGIRLQVFDPKRHLSLPQLIECASSASFSVGRKEVLAYVLVGMVRAAGVHRGNPNWQLHFERRAALGALRTVGLPVPDGYINEAAAAARLGVRTGTLRARVVSNPEVRRVLRVHGVTTAEHGKEIRFYDPAAVGLPSSRALFERARRRRAA